VNSTSSFRIAICLGILLGSAAPCTAAQVERPLGEVDGAPSQGQEPKLGDVNDGSRSPAVHLIELFDEDGARIDPGAANPLPFSPRQTCLPCHDYAAVGSGWHFNAADPNAPAGRRGEPWVLVDRATATQVPLSLRGWPGTAKPEEFGLSPFLFTETFGRHLNGGGISETESDEPLDIYWRWRVSGPAEINCLSCHDTEAGHDQAEYARQMGQQNYRWAAAATSGFASVVGSARGMPDNYDIYAGSAPDLGQVVPPGIAYDESRFNDERKVLLGLSRDIPAERCYFCHSAKAIGETPVERWEADEDVHLTAGLTCVDCHRNGLDHLMTRGYEWEGRDRNEASVASLSCAGCHIGDDEADVPTSGRHGAPAPAHKGLPTIHFDKLSCTACHSGPRPAQQAQRVKLSRTHALGTHQVHRGDDVVPYIMSPVYVRDDDGKIAPHRLMWPAYWGFERDGDIEPAPLADVRAIALATVLEEATEDSPNVVRLSTGDWPQFSESQMIRILGELATLHPDRGTPVYIGGGKLFRAAGSAVAIEEAHPAAQPYTWAFAHDVRPAQQSLGVRGCDDCHSTGAPFAFGTVTAPLPLEFAAGSTLSMESLQDTGAAYSRAFALSFLFRPLFKYLITICCIVLMLLLLLYSLKGLESMLESWSSGGPRTGT